MIQDDFVAPENSISDTIDARTPMTWPIRCFGITIIVFSILLIGKTFSLTGDVLTSVGDIARATNAPLVIALSPIAHQLLIGIAYVMIATVVMYLYLVFRRKNEPNRFAAVTVCARTVLFFSILFMPTAVYSEAPSDIAARLAELGVKSGMSLPTADNVLAIRAISIFGKSATTVTDSDCRLFKQLPKLAKLSVNGANLSAVCLTEIAAIPVLSELSIANSNVDSGGLSQLSSASQLKAIDISSSGISDQGLAAVARIPQVESIIMRGLPITDQGLKSLAESGKGVRKLVIANSRSITSAGLTYIAAMPSLRELDLWTCMVGGGLSALTKSATIEDLVISATGATNSDMEAIGEMRSLKRLISFDNLGVSDTGVAKLVKLGALKELNLSKTSVTDVGVASLAKLQSLEN